MGTTRRKLYGKSRRRRQRGKGLGTLCKGAILAALLVLNGAHAEDIGFRGRVSNWWNNPNPLNPGPSVELANYITSMDWAPSVDLYPSTCAPPAGINEAKVVEPYLDEVTVHGMHDGHKYKGPDGRVFELNTWRDNRDAEHTYTLSVIYDDDGSSARVKVGRQDKFEVVPLPLPPTEDEDKYDGGKRKRKSRRKTLRRK